VSQLPLVVTDSRARPIDLGDQIDGGNDIAGIIVDFPERGSGKVAVAVQWPDSPIPEVFETALRFAGEIAVLCCEEIVAL
jgi:hypothetical protein